MCTVLLYDLHSGEEFVELHHRPESDASLKNKKSGERVVSLSTRTCNILQDYTNEHRHDVRDGYER